jgi:hypothetical protein
MRHAEMLDTQHAINVRSVKSVLYCAASQSQQCSRYIAIRAIELTLRQISTEKGERSIVAIKLKARPGK